MAVEPNTVVKLLSNVPLNNTYEHQMTFTDKTAQETYFTNRPSFTFMNMSYQREEQAVKVQGAYDELYHCNYMMYQNSYYTNKWFYAFITKKEYVNPNTTRIYFEIDPWQTWQFDLTFHDSFIERKHCKRWNADGSPVINTVDEGVDYGSEYVTEWMDQYQPYGDIYFLVVASKQGMHKTGETDYRDQMSSGTVGIPTPLNYFVHPFYFSELIPDIASIAEINPVANWSLSNVITFLNALYSNTNAVENIVSIYITDNVGAFEYTASPESLSLGTTELLTARIMDDAGGNTADTFFVTEKPYFEPQIRNWGNKYNDYRPTTESKLLMHPYTQFVMTDFRGNHITYKNEYIQGDTLEIISKGSIGSSNYTSFGVKYNVGGISSDNAQIASNNHAVLNTKPSDVPILNQYLAAYLQGHKNTLNVQQDALAFESLKGLGGALFAGAAGAAGGLAMTGASSYLKAKGMIAKLHDIRNTPPGLSKMGSNSAYDYGNEYKGVYLMKQQITPEYQRKLEDYFMLYGYKLNEVQPIDFNTRINYDFIKTVGANITGDVPANDLTRIISMFDDGVTLWHTENVGDYSLPNDEV